MQADRPHPARTSAASGFLTDTTLPLPSAPACMKTMTHPEPEGNAGAASHCRRGKVAHSARRGDRPSSLPRARKPPLAERRSRKKRIDDAYRQGATCAKAASPDRPGNGMPDRPGASPPGCQTTRVPDYPGVRSPGCEHTRVRRHAGTKALRSEQVCGGRSEAAGIPDTRAARPFFIDDPGRNA